jgi:hypothetical protein
MDPSGLPALMAKALGRVRERLVDAGRVSPNKRPVTIA